MSDELNRNTTPELTFEPSAAQAVEVPALTLEPSAVFYNRKTSLAFMRRRYINLF